MVNGFSASFRSEIFYDQAIGNDDAFCDLRNVYGGDGVHHGTHCADGDGCLYGDALLMNAFYWSDDLLSESQIGCDVLASAAK